MTQLSKNARARRRAQRARAAALEAVTARLLGAPTFSTTTGRLQKDDMLDAFKYGSQWTLEEMTQMQNRLKLSGSKLPVINKTRGLCADHIIIDEFTDLERRITS